MNTQETSPSLPANFWQAKAPPPKKMTPGQAMARRLEDRKAIMGTTTGGASPETSSTKRTPPKPGVPAAFGDFWQTVKQEQEQ